MKNKFFEEEPCCEHCQRVPRLKIITEHSKLAGIVVRDLIILVNFEIAQRQEAWDIT